ALVVGGSGLYLRAIRGGIFAGPSPSPEIRARLTALADQQGVRYLFDRLADIDPEAAGRIESNDLKRVVRALEIYQQTGLPISHHQRRHRFAERPFETLIVGLTLPRPELYASIEGRFNMMIAQGLVEEVRSLLANGSQLPLDTIGYREVAKYVRGEVSLAEAIRQGKQASRRLAKRQLTWFRADPEIVWLDASHGPDEALKLFREFFSGQISSLRPPSLQAKSDCFHK
ncbi:MAG: tRNA (adenosine(37)-N6)-dimethylallyltransferase MiaA, partial [Deltaproteobacteria bacterium]|nr:tRNA (adenosine(37)-N6)-dimethylallyltransferase MiaA [Deltaproteobacteria bacterium]